MLPGTFPNRGPSLAFQLEELDQLSVRIDNLEKLNARLIDDFGDRVIGLGDTGPQVLKIGGLKVRNRCGAGHRAGRVFCARHDCEPATFDIEGHEILKRDHRRAIEERSVEGL